MKPTKKQFFYMLLEYQAYIDLQGEREHQAYNILKGRTFSNTWEFDEELLESTGMDAEFASVWKAVG